MFKPNASTLKDSYKLGHSLMYPEGTKKVYSNFTPRSMNHFNNNVPDRFRDNKIVFFGIQAVVRELVELWDETFFKVPLEEATAYFKRRTKPFTGDYDFPIEKLEYLHKLGYLPLRIRALPEGSRVPVGVPVFTIENTDSECYWLTNDQETILSTESWLMSTSATIANKYREIIEYWADQTGGSKEFITWQGHDFSMRGMEGALASMKSGAGHLTSFHGSDVVPAVDFIEYYYRGAETFVAASVPASEHSVMTFNGPMGEKETIRRIIQDIYPVGVVSVVADSYDYWNTLTNIASELKDVIMNRKPDSLGLAKVVFRPDSGDPVKIICGYTHKEGTNAFEHPEYEAYREIDEWYLKEDWESNEYGDVWVKAGAKPISESEVKGSVETLWEIFGGTTNDKGFRTLDSHVGLIYGDSITMERANRILKRLAGKGFASDNIVFGLGSFTYQYNTRDTLGFAVKATFGVDKDGNHIEIFKDPKTDNGTKKSARGLLRVDKVDGNYVLRDRQTWDEHLGGELRTIFVDGKFENEVSFAEIRQRIADERKIY